MTTAVMNLKLNANLDIVFMKRAMSGALPMTSP